MPFTVKQFLFDTPIYTKVHISEDDFSSAEFDALFLSKYSDSFDIEGYNPWRKADSTFTITKSLSYSDNKMQQNGGIEAVQIMCRRYSDVFRFFIYWNAADMVIFKIGQFPSVADFHLGELKQYSKVLPKEKLKELTRAIGIAASGVGIGSFVYLRRIFEYLIDEAYQQAKSAEAIDEQEFRRAKMAEKINMLHSYLPTFLVENKKMYSILSIGIHELDEQTCLTNFDTLRIGIELILDEKLVALQRKEKADLAKQKLAALNSALKK